MVFNFTPSTNGTFTPPTVQFQLLDAASPGEVSWTVLCNETTFAGLGTSGLFLNESEAANEAGAKALQGLANGTEVNAQQARPKKNCIRSYRLLMAAADQFSDLRFEKSRGWLALLDILWKSVFHQQIFASGQSEAHNVHPRIL
jgi:hypothetical protein